MNYKDLSIGKELVIGFSTILLVSFVIGLVATLQIQEIINEKNNSVNLALGVTDQGVKTVEVGRILVAQSGEVIEILAENVEETAQAFIQISSSNQQQMTGTNQIILALENIKLASEQNETDIRQTQIAAHDLNALDNKLKEIIENLNFNGGNL